MRHRLEQCSLQALHVGGHHAGHDQTHVGQAGVGHQPFHVALGQGDQRSVQNPDDGQQPDPGPGGVKGVGEKRQAEADQAIDRHLGQHRGQQDGHWSRRLDVGVGQPGVQRPDGRLDRKGQDKGQEKPQLGAPLQGQLVECQQIEGQHARFLEVECGQGEDGHQHQRAAGHGIEEELEGGIDTALTAPAADEEVGRHQHRLPKDVE